ncbi:MAG: alpha/beta fold hydrolase [Mycoplasmoidaceae bacterium]
MNEKMAYEPRIVDINHLKQYVIKKENATKNLLFIHPFTGRFDDKLVTFEKLYNHNIYGIEVAGHGKSMNFSENEIDLFEYINQVYSFIKQEKLDKFDILSHSMGGGISFVIACYFNNQVDNLIAETPISPALILKQEFLKNLIPINLEQQIILLEALVYNPDEVYGKNYQSKARYFLMESRQNEHLRKLLDVQAMDLVYNYLKIIMKKLSTKTTIILGQKDGVIGTEETFKYFKSLDNNLIDLKIVPKTGHLVYLENPLVFDDIVLKKLGY